MLGSFLLTRALEWYAGRILMIWLRLPLRD